MKRRRASAEVLEAARPDPIPSPEPEPEPPSAFEAAEDLLLSALDEVRVAPADPATSAAEQGADSQVLTARRPYRRNRGLAHDLDALVAGLDGGCRGRSRRGRQERGEPPRHGLREEELTT